MKQKRDHLLMMLLLIFACFGHVAVTQAQTQEIVIKTKNESLPKAFKLLEKATKYKVMYVNKDVASYTVDRNVKAWDVSEAMTQLLTGKPLSFKIDK